MIDGCALQLKVPKTGDAQDVMSFRKLLLNRCQHEFETDQKEEGDFARMQEAIDSASSVSVVYNCCPMCKVYVSRVFIWQHYANVVLAISLELQLEFC